MEGIWYYYCIGSFGLGRIPLKLSCIVHSIQRNTLH